MNPPASATLSLNRRAFLQRTALTAGAFAMLSGTRASGRILGANDRLRIAVAGCNGAASRT